MTTGCPPPPPRASYIYIAYTDQCVDNFNEISGDFDINGIQLVGACSAMLIIFF